VNTRYRALLAAAIGGLVLAGCDAAAVDPGGHDDHAEDSAPIEGATEVAVAAGSMAFDPDDLEVEVGQPVNFVLTSTDALHDLTIDEVDFHVAAARDETVTGGVHFDQPGTYTAYCSVPGHRRAGMELDITVR
jgi:nitrite reductase (NO-forming)